MAKKLYEEEKIRAIAERIRLHTGEDNLMTTAQMPEGVNSVYMVGNADGYDTGYFDGEDSVKTNEARTADNISGEEALRDVIEITVDAGYYTADTKKQLDVSFAYYYGWDDGWNEASNFGGYAEGFDDGYAEGYADGESETEFSLITLIEQAQSSTFVRNPYNSNYYFPTEVYGAYGGSTFEDMAEIEYSSLSSNPLTISVGNYTSFYLSALITAHDKANQEQILGEMVVPPNGTNSIDFVSNASSPCDWEYTIDGVRYMEYEP